MCTLKVTSDLYHPVTLGEKGSDSPTSLTELRKEGKGRFKKKKKSKPGHSLSIRSKQSLAGPERTIRLDTSKMQLGVFSKSRSGRQRGWSERHTLV